jgi:hypothetical protein
MPLSCSDVEGSETFNIKRGGRLGTVHVLEMVQKQEKNLG